MDKTKTKKGCLIEEIRQPKILTALGKWRTCGMGWEAISRLLKKECDIQATTATIRNVYNTYLEHRTEIVAANQEIKDVIKDEINDTVIDTKKTLGEIHEFVRDMMARAKGSDDRLALDCAKEILNQLYYQERVLNRMQAGVNIESINKIEITQIVVKKLDELEKSGRIKVMDVTLKPVMKGEVYEVKEDE